MVLDQVLMHNKSNIKLERSQWINSRGLHLELLEEVTAIYLKITHLLHITDQFNSLKQPIVILFQEHQMLMKNSTKKIILTLQVLANTQLKPPIWQILNTKIKQNLWLPEMVYLNSVIKVSLDQQLMIKSKIRVSLDLLWFQRLLK